MLLGQALPGAFQDMNHLKCPNSISSFGYQTPDFISPGLQSCYSACFSVCFVVCSLVGTDRQFPRPNYFAQFSNPCKNWHFLKLYLSADFIESTAATKKCCLQDALPATQ